MAFYYFEKQDPENPNKIIREYFADEIVDIEDIICASPGGIENFDKYKEIVELINVPLYETFLKNIAVKTNSGFTLIPHLKESQYQDPELIRIERSNTPIEIEVVPDDPETFLKDKPHIKVEGKHKPEPAWVKKMVDFNALPKFTELSQENLDHYKKVEDEMPTLTEIKRGMKVKILGKHLKIRPLSNKNQGFFLVNSKGKELDLTDFLEVNTTNVLLLSVPKDLPADSYKIHIRSGWYADDTIERLGESYTFKIV